MSLVNQMLKDLDARRPAEPPPDVLTGLKSAPPVHQTSYKLGIGIGSLVLLVLVGVLAWQTDSLRPAATPPPQPGSPATLPAPPQAASEPAPANGSAVAAVVAGLRQPPLLDTLPLTGSTASPGPVEQAGTAPEPEPAAPAGQVDAAPPASPADGESDATPQVRKTQRPLSKAARAEKAFTAAIEALREGRMRQAEARLESVITLRPAHTGARETLAGLLLHQQRNGEALQVVEDGLAGAPRHPAFARLYARLILEQGRTAEAVQVLEAALVNAAEDADFLGLLAGVYQRHGDYAQAVETYRAALALQPREPRWWLGLGLGHERLGAAEAAREAYARAGQLPGLDAATRSFVRGRLQRMSPAGGRP